ncbi:hypothetical protein FRC12_020248 [Ceratobasidium sp. 428]|nr:hypothetical protein FRC12_020248 [Ceratobasidium sp. 428]
MSSLPPRPPTQEAQSIPKHMNRLAKRDPQLYPVRLTQLGTLLLADFGLMSHASHNNLSTGLSRLFPSFSDHQLAAIMAVTVGVAAYFFTSKPTGADQGHVAPTLPSRVKEEVDKHKAGTK